MHSPIHHLEPTQNPRQRACRVHHGAFDPQTLELVVLVHLALVHRPIVLEPLHIVHPIEAFDLFRNWYTAGGHVRWNVGQRAHSADLDELAVLREQRWLGRRVFCEYLRLAELGLEALREGADAFVLEAAVDELFVLWGIFCFKYNKLIYFGH